MRQVSTAKNLVTRGCFLARNWLLATFGSSVTFIQSSKTFLIFLKLKIDDAFTAFFLRYLYGFKARAWYLCLFSCFFIGNDRSSVLWLLLLNIYWLGGSSWQVLELCLHEQCPKAFLLVYCTIIFILVAVKMKTRHRFACFVLYYLYI